MQDVDQPALHQLRFGHGGHDPQHRLVGKEHGALGHGMNVAREAQAGQIVEQAIVEAAGGFQPGDFRLTKLQVFEEIQHLFQAGGDQKVAAFGQFAHEQFEHGRVGHALIDITLQHGELIDIREQRAGQRIEIPAHAASRSSRVTGTAPAAVISAMALSPSPGFTFTARMASISSKTAKPLASASFTVLRTQ